MQVFVQEPLGLFIQAFIEMICEYMCYEYWHMYCLEYFVTAHHLLLWYMKRLLCYRWTILPVGETDTGPLFTKGMDVLPPNLVNSRSREIGCYNDCTALKFDRHLGRGARQISKHLEKSKPESHGFETSRDLAVRRPSAWWIEAQTSKLGLELNWHGDYIMAM